jgi:protein SCO1/2
MKALLASLLLATASLGVADDHPAPAADAALPQGSLYAFDATWTKQTGDKVEWKKSAGTARVLALGYATCKGVCPRILGDMQRIEKELAKELAKEELAGCRFTFVSLDPANDKVPELKALGERHKVDDTRWDLLTGDEESVLELAVALGVRYDRLPNGIDFAHSYLIAVIGPDGTLRHKWTEPGEGPGPSVLAVKQALEK